MKARAQRTPPVTLPIPALLHLIRHEPDWPPSEPLPIRPRVRADCQSVPRPCPWVGCRHHLYLEVKRNGALKLNFPDLEPGDLAPDRSCSLDGAEEGGMTLQVAGDRMNLTRERTRQIEVRARVQLRADPEAETLVDTLRASCHDVHVQDMLAPKSRANGDRGYSIWARAGQQVERLSDARTLEDAVRVAEALRVSAPDGQPVTLEIRRGRQLVRVIDDAAQSLTPEDFRRALRLVAQWHEGARSLYREGATAPVELGPLSRAILGGAAVRADLATSLSQVFASVGQLIAPQNREETP